MSNELNQKKKKILLKILESLYSTWPLAGGIYLLINEADISDKMLDSLLEIMKNAMKDMKDLDAKRKMKEKIELLEKMKTIEATERIEELYKLEKLLKLLDNIY